MGRLEVRVTAADVGKRVSIRRLDEDRESGASFTDTVGVLTSWDDDVLIVTRRTGERVRIAAATLVAGKVVPPAPARRRGPSASYEELARAAARSWQPAEHDRLGDWELRATIWDGPDGTRRAFTRRANSVLPLGDPGLPLDEALARVRAWYAERGRPAYIQTAVGAEGTQELLEAGLEARGWVCEVASELRTGSLAPLADPAGDDQESAVGRVRLARELDDAWLRRYNRSGGDGVAPVTRVAPQIRGVLTSGPSVWFATVPDGAESGGAAPAAIGRCVVDGRWAGFMAVEVAPQARRRGLATAVMTALARQALAEGASAAWLQVESDNTAARALYDGMGFDVHHVYHHYRA